jgi:UDP-2,3-diacylglucosamine hydrolase
VAHLTSYLLPLPNLRPDPAQSQSPSQLAGRFQRPVICRVHCQHLVVVGDAHLGRGSAEAERALLHFLERVPDLGDGLLIAGDLFEFWFAWRRVIPRRGARVVGALAALRHRLPVLLVGGNHDRWAADFWQTELDIGYSAGEAHFTVGAREAIAVHGDGITETHWSASLLHAVTRHPLTIGLFRLLHPDLSCWMVDRLSGVLGDATRDAAAIEAAAARQASWAHARLASDARLGLVVMGHTHVPAGVEVGPGQWYLNPGAWCEGFRYATAGPDGVALHHFEP